MRKVARVVVLFLLSLLSTAVLSTIAAILATVSLAATALIVPGTGTPNANGITGYMTNFRDYYMQKPCADNGGCPNNDLEGVNYPATFWPIPLPGWCPGFTCDTFNQSVAKGVQQLKIDADGTSGPFLIAGYSQGARVASIAKMHYLNGDWVGQTPDAFVFIGNPNRPNGGLLSRLGFIPYIPILDVTTGQPTPNQGTPAFPDGIPTEDWAIRWEGIADWPTYLFNPLAVANSLLGFYYDHGTYLAFNAKSDPGETPAGYTLDEWKAITANPENYPGIVDIQKYGDTTYYTITPKTLPLVRPLHLIPFIGKPIADLFEPMLRVLIEETGYARWIPFGAPIGTGTIPIFNPITLFLKLIPALLVGINNFFANFGLTQEIPLSPTTPNTPSPVMSTLTSDEEGTPDDTSLTENADDSSGARMMAFVNENADVKMLPIEGDEQPPVAGEDGLTPVEGTETPIDEGTVEPVGTVTPPEGTVEPVGTVVPEGTIDPTGTPIEGTVPGNGNAEEGGEPEVVNPPQELNHDPEESRDPAENRVDANGGSVSLSFSPHDNKPGESPANGGGEDPEPVDAPAPTAPTAPSAGTDNAPADSEPAAA